MKTFLQFIVENILLEEEQPFDPYGDLDKISDTDIGKRFISPVKSPEGKVTGWELKFKTGKDTANRGMIAGFVDRSGNLVPVNTGTGYNSLGLRMPRLVDAVAKKLNFEINPARNTLQDMATRMDDTDMMRIFMPVPETPTPKPQISPSTPASARIPPVSRPSPVPPVSRPPPAPPVSSAPAVKGKGRLGLVTGILGALGIAGSASADDALFGLNPLSVLDSGSLGTDDVPVEARGIRDDMIIPPKPAKPLVGSEFMFSPKK